MSNRNGQTALITGASSGIGYDLLDLFARDGYDLVLVARNEAKLRETAAHLKQKHGIDAQVIPADLSNPEAPGVLARALQQRGIEVDVLVNNAGYGLAGAFLETDLKKELAMIQVNIVALVELTKLLLPGMVGRKRGRIMNVASTAAFVPGPLMSIYYATKAFVLSFSEALAEELGDSGVSVTALCPGPTATGFSEAAGATKTRLFATRKPMTSADVARAGYGALMSGKRIVIPGLSNKLMTQSLRISPRRAVAKVVRRLQEQA